MSEMSFEKPHQEENLSWFRIIVAVLVILVVLFVVFVAPRPYPRRRVNLIACQAYLHALGIALRFYADEHDDVYPTVDKWCDLLVTTSSVADTKQFICRGSDAKIGESSYALNKNVVGKKASEIPEDTVLLFEAEKGWNQVGGPELLTLENHDGKGCSVLFNDGHVEFVKKERIADLNWGVEK